MSDSIPVWAAITLPLVGFAAALATELLRGSQTLKRDREARHENTISERKNARDSFERETLIELQESIAALMRNTGAIFHETEIEFGTHGTWGRRQLPERIGGESSVSLVRDFQKLRVRILDDELRQLAAKWWESVRNRRSVQCARNRMIKLVSEPLTLGELVSHYTSNSTRNSASDFVLLFPIGARPRNE